MHLANSFASSSFGDSHSKFLILQVASWKIVYNRYWQPYFCTLVVLMKICTPRLQTVRMISWCARPHYFVFNHKRNSAVWKCAAENVIAVWILSCRSTVSHFPDISFTFFSTSLNFAKLRIHRVILQQPNHFKGAFWNMVKPAYKGLSYQNQFKWAFLMQSGTKSNQPTCTSPKRLKTSLHGPHLTWSNQFTLAQSNQLTWAVKPAYTSAVKPVYTSSQTSLH